MPSSSANTETNQVDYQKYLKIEKAAKTETYSGILICFLHSKTSQILLNYSLTSPKK